ncbi:hypothetical protein HHI36_002639 [Cryptolaemus montrouzieri]|uniref:Uncharacterized protein n=1 Tax=Cryptolaemus montrouzieri TaxID=559131 RepID=A0ABD2PBK2_9CUCU
MLSLGLLILVSFHVCDAVFHTSNETDLSRCKVHYSRSGTAYKDYYELTKPKITNESDLVLDFHFSVLAPSDAHILLATSKVTQKNDPAYELVIGAGGNSFCDIRRMQKSQVKESVRIKDLLSALDIRSFWIHMTEDGELAIGKEGEDIAFISWKDPNPLAVKVISFSTWPGIEAKWFFDCITDDIKLIKRKLTPAERLRKDLLTNYNPYVRPVKNHSDDTIIQFNPMIYNIVFDDRYSILDSYGYAVIEWNDEKLVWNKSDYNGIEEMRVNTIDIWKPNLILYNSVNPDLPIFGADALIVMHTGKIKWYPKLLLKSWCGGDDYGNWPKDILTCDIIFTFWTDFSNIQLVYSGSIISNPIFPQWTVRNSEVFSNSTGPPSIGICFTLQRRSQAYTLIFLSPYLVIATSLLCVFCVSPFGSTKIGLACFTLLLSIMCLIVLGAYLPAHPIHVPYIVQLYAYTIIAATTTIIISICVINLSRTERQGVFPKFLSRILTSKVVKLIFCLPEIKKDEYGKLSLASKMKDSQQFCILLGTIIDRICLVLGIGLVIYSIHCY